MLDYKLTMSYANAERHSSHIGEMSLGMFVFLRAFLLCVIMQRID